MVKRMAVSACTEVAEATLEFKPPNTASKCALACDALANGKSHAVQSAKSYLDTLLQTFDLFLVASDRDGPFDVKVLDAVDRSSVYVNEYREFILAVAATGQMRPFELVLIEFLEGVLKHKKTPGAGHSQAYLWRDSLRFIARELFVSTISALLLNKHWSTVRTLLQHPYQPPGLGTFSFEAFDGYFRSVDHFRNRRLKLQRISVSSDILKERMEASVMRFENIVQTDFVLHLYSLLRGEESLSFWVPRTISYAQDKVPGGFDLFVAARNETTSSFLQQLFEIQDWPLLLSAVRDRINPMKKRAQLNADALDYEGFLAANSSTP